MRQMFRSPPGCNTGFCHIHRCMKDYVEAFSFKRWDCIVGASISPFGFRSLQQHDLPCDYHVPVMVLSNRPYLDLVKRATF